LRYRAILLRSLELLDPRIWMECASGAWAIAPGETRHAKVLLNYEHDLSKAGIYSVRASRTLNYGSAAADLADLSSGVQLKTESLFHIVVEDGNPENLIGTFQPYVADLQSKDEERQREQRGLSVLWLRHSGRYDPFHAGLSSYGPFCADWSQTSEHFTFARALAKIVQGTSGTAMLRNMRLNTCQKWRIRSISPSAR